MIVTLWPVAVVVSIAVAVLQYHLYDERLVIRRVVVYGGLTIALTALFVGVYFGVLATLSGQVVAGRYRWVAVAFATAAVLAAEPVRRRLQTRLERRFLGERGDPLGVLAQLHATLSNGDEDEEGPSTAPSPAPWHKRSTHPPWPSGCIADHTSKPSTIAGAPSRTRR